MHAPRTISHSHVDVSFRKSGSCILMFIFFSQTPRITFSRVELRGVHVVETRTG